MNPVFMRDGVSALFIAACQPRQAGEAENAAPQSQSSQETVPTGPLAYQRSCLMGGCDWPVYQAALYDYVGAVYDLSGRVRYDDYLSTDERVFVEERIGALRTLESLDDVRNFISRARRKFFSAIDPEFETHPTYCNSQAYDNGTGFLLYSLENPQFGEAVVLGGIHLCGEEYGNMYLREGHELKVASEPEDWVFFLESNEYAEIQRNNDEFRVTHEQAHFERIAKVLNIPVANPITAVTSQEVAAYVEEQGLSRLEAVRQIVFTMAAKRFYTPIFQNENISHLSSQVRVLHFFKLIEDLIKQPGQTNPVEIVAQIYDLDSEVLRQECLQFLTPQGADGRYAHLKKRIEQMNETFAKLRDASNRLTAESLPDLIRKHNKPKALFMIGAKHAEAIDAVYKP